MRRLTVLQFAATFGFALIVLGNQACEADAQGFIVEEATYSGTGGVFKCVANLAKGQTATINLTVAADQADRVFASIHSGVGVKLRRTNGQDPEIITVTAFRPEEKSTFTQVRITYRTEFKVLDAYSFRYGIRLDKDSNKEDVKLLAYLHVHDRSASDAAWSDAKLWIKRPAPIVQDICLDNVRMDARRTFVTCYKLSDRCTVNLSRQGPDYYATSKNLAYEVQTLTNNCGVMLQAGDIRVMSASGKLRYGTVLRDNLENGKKADLLTTPVSSAKLLVKAETVTGRWHRARAVKNGILYYDAGGGTLTTVTNKMKEPASLKIEGFGDVPNPIKKGEKLEFFKTAGKPVGSSTDLLNFSPSAISSRVGNLEDLSDFPENTWSLPLKKRFEDSTVELKEISQLNAKIQTQTVLLTNTIDLIEQATDSSAVDFLKARRNQLETSLADMKAERTEGIGSLVSKLKELNTPEPK